MSDTEMLQKTPLYQAHVELGAKMAPFGGWLMPIQYEGILAEHAHTRRAVSVFDICHMGEFIIDDDPVRSGLDYVVTQNISSMPLGTCRYGFMLNKQAGIVDDLIVYRLKDRRWMVVVNASTISNDEEHLRKYLTGKYTLENASRRIAKLDVQGPESGGVLQAIFGDSILKLNYYSFADFTFANERCIISRTGYTGELGYEIYVSSQMVTKLWDLLLNDKRVKPAGLGSRDTLRLEMAYPLYGQDIEQNHSPISAGLERFVDFSKSFLGKEALKKEKDSGSRESLICFQADSRRAPRHGFGIFSVEGRHLGTVTSGSFSPSLGVGIGMGYVVEKPNIGDKILIKDGNTQIPVSIVKKPFYKRGGSVS